MERIGALSFGPRHRDGREIHEAVRTLLAIGKVCARAIGVGYFRIFTVVL
jgi:enhancing lycopene biosynthesis protein 2